eukprot:4938570-Prymnesium_polylepis.1
MFRVQEDDAPESAHKSARTLKVRMVLQPKKESNTNAWHTASGKPLMRKASVVRIKKAIPLRDIGRNIATDEPDVVSDE